MLTISLYLNWWKNWKTLPVKQWILAAKAYKVQDYSKAIELYRKGIEKNTNHPAICFARLDLAYCLLKKAEYSQAEFQLRQVIYNKTHSKRAYKKLLALYMHIGNYLEASWCARRALDEFPTDPVIQSYFIFSVIENGGPANLILEIEKLKNVVSNSKDDIALRYTAQAVYELNTGFKNKASKIFAHVLLQKKVPYETYLYYGSMLLAEGEVMLARRYLRQALRLEPSYPKIIRLFAESYLKPGPLYRPEFAMQLATTAAQQTNWQNPWCLHVLAEAYKKSGNNMAALITATKAKTISKSDYEFYPRQNLLGELIESLESVESVEPQ
jgi:tetratricopeptide (TPR) repeat protein